MFPVLDLVGSAVHDHVHFAAIDVSGSVDSI